MSNFYRLLVAVTILILISWAVAAQNKNIYTSGLDLRKPLNRDSLTLLTIPTYQQKKDYTCGPSSAVMALNYYNKKAVEEDIAKGMGTTSEKGTPPKNIAKWLNDNGFKAKYGENGTLDLLRENLKNKIPTLIEWIDWGGHWALVAGYDTMGTKETNDDMIILADPYDRIDGVQDGFTYHNAERFETMWFDALYLDKLTKGIYIEVRN